MDCSGSLKYLIPTIWQRAITTPQHKLKFSHRFATHNTKGSLKPHHPFQAAFMAYCV
nr:hypothetical protein [uncultured Kingella sp.]